MTVRILRAVMLAGTLLGVGAEVVAADALPPLLKALDLRSYRAGSAPPSFSGQSLDGRATSIDDFRGRVVVINFWATWCVDCRAEMPMFEALHREFAARGFVSVGVNVRESQDVVGRYARALGLTFPLVLDPDGRISGLYGVVALPATFMLARDGRAVGFAVGARDWRGPAARALIQALLDERAATLDLR